MIHEEISKEYQKLQIKISNLEKQIQFLPKGKLFCTTNGKYHKWYHTTLFPDFTIRHPKSGEFYYWEHFGLIDDPGYRKNAMSKLQLYASHGIFPTINLITTYETKYTPLNPEYVNLLVSHYFINV